jgi:DNA-binding transcriptional MerR regulator
MLKIGQLARRLGLNVRTVRYYEAIGLLPTPARSEGGYRLYTDEDERRLRFVLQAKRVGFTLDEIQRILQLGVRGTACGYVRDTLNRHLAEIDARLADLQRVRSELSAAATSWQEVGTARDGLFCRLIEQWFPSPHMMNQEMNMATQKRQVEVFTAGCSICEPVVEMVRRIACPNCDVTIYNVKEDPKAAERARVANVQRLPMVLVDGKSAECCHVGPVTEAGLRAAGIGSA